MFKGKNPCLPAGRLSPPPKFKSQTIYVFMNKKIIFIVIIIAIVLLGYWYFLKKTSSQNPAPQTPQAQLTEIEAKKIAEENCIKGGESLSSGSYNENSKTWWFDANLNSEKDGCNPACVVFEETKTAEINWRCTGLIIPENESASEIIKQLFAKKYPKYAKTISVRIDKETASHIRGGVSMEAGVPGGIFLATKINEGWQIIHDGNGEIPCSLSTYGFPAEMLSDCAK